MRKRIWSLCMALVLCLGLLPHMSVPASAAGSENIYVGGVLLSGSEDSPVYATTEAGQVMVQEDYTEADPWNIKWDGSTLTLQDAVVTTNTSVRNVVSENAYLAPVVRSYDGTIPLFTPATTIQLIGENQLIGQTGSFQQTYGEGFLAGIVVSGDLTIRGPGTLIAKGADKTSGFMGITFSAGIVSEENMTIESGATVVADGGELSASYRTTSAGIYANGDITISGSTVTATGAEAGTSGSSNTANSYGIGADGTVSISDSEVTASSAEASAAQSYSLPRSSGIWTPSGCTISGDTTITATGSHQIQYAITPGKGINTGSYGSITVTPPEGKAVLMQTGTDADNLTAVVTGGLISREQTFNSDALQTYVQSEVVDLDASVVTKVTVSSDSSSVLAGETLQFSAQVDGVGSYSQDVTWSVEGNVSERTTIDETGLLTVAEDETAPQLTVKATSQESPISGTAAVTVDSRVTGITILPEVTEVPLSSAQQFTAVVSGVGNYSKDVTWTVEGNGSSYTKIDSDGTLHVYAKETAETLTIKATSKVDPGISGARTVAVTSNVFAVIISPNSATVSVGETQQFTVTVSGYGDYSRDVTWSVEGSDSDSGDTKISDTGLLTVAEDEKSNALTVKVTSVQNPSKSGTAAVTITSKIEGITITPSPATVPVGGTQQFSAQVAGGDGAAQTVNWTVEDNTSEDTTISADGLLTVAEDEKSPQLTVKATSQQNSSIFGTATVTVTHTCADKVTLISGKAATCTVDGAKAYYLCPICGKAFEDAGCAKEISNLENWKVIPAPGHQWSAYQTTADGHSRTCEVCQETENGAHQYATEDAGTCTVCGYARWYTVTFDANEGSVSPASAKTENGKLSALPTPTRTGHVFMGWYTDKDGGELVTEETVFSSDTTLYARWRVKTPPVITVNMDPTEGGSCLVAEITSDMVIEDLTQLDPKPLENGTYTAKEFGSAIILFPQAAPGYMIDTADYDKLPGEDENTVSFDGPEDFSYISITTERDLTVNLTFREASNLTVGDATLSNGPVCYATTDGSGHVTPQPDYTENDSWNIKWDSANSTLTLRNASIQGIVDGNGSSCGIFYEASLSIVLEGTNQVTGADVDTTNGSAMSIGIYGKGKLSFSGSGSLTATAGKSASSVGIAAEGALTFGDQVKVEASGADISVTGDVDVSSIKWGGQSAGVFSSASITVQDEADVTAAGGHYQVSESSKTNIGFSTGCQSMQVSVQGGKLTATAQESTNDWFGIEAYTITISGGEIIARGNPVFYWENSEEEDLRCVFTVVPPAGKLFHVEAGNGGSLTEIEGSPFTTETSLDSSLFRSDTAFHCYLEDDPTHQHTYDQWKYDETNHWHVCACGASADDAAPHVYDNDQDDTCNFCGYQRELSHVHQGVLVPGTPATCTEAGTKAYYTCTCRQAFEDENCTIPITDLDNWIVIPATDHTWSDTYLKENADAEKHYHVCTVCGAKDAGQAHTWNAEAATEQNDKHCTICGYVAEAQLGHTHTYGTEWEFDKNSHWHQCSCGAITDVAAHVYDNDQDADCNVCGYERQVTPPVGTEYTVNFDANGGSVSLSSAVTTDGKLASLPTPILSDYEFMGWYTEAVGGQLVTINTVFTSDTTIYARWKQVQFSVSGTVYDHEGTAVSGATVVLMQGNDQIGTDTTNGSGEFTFTQHIPAGAYNIVTTYKPADGEEQIKTSLVVITVQDVAVNVTLPSPGVNSTLTVTESTPAVVVGGLDAEAQEQKASDVDVTKITVSMAVEKKPEAQAEGSSQIQQAAAAGATLEYLEIAITKTVVTSESTVDSKISETKTVLEIVVPFAFTDKKNVMVYRYHNGMTEALTEADTKADGTFQLDAANGLIRIFASKFSTYAIGYTMDEEEPVTPPATGGSSHDDTPTYSVTLPGKMTGGTVTAAKRYAEEGETFRFTVTPDEGYELDSLSVTDSNGSELALTVEGGGEHSFEMPARRVSIQVTFRAAETSLPFTDVGENYWAHNEIAWAYENSYMSGTSATTFNPSGTVSRQQVWMILARTAGENPANMAEAKAWAIANGISDGTNPGSAVTRQQLAALLYRYAVLFGYDVSAGEDTNILSYTDVAQVSEYAVPAMQWACGAGIITGTGDGSTLSPQGQATRAQLAVMLHRWLV